MAISQIVTNSIAPSQTLTTPIIATTMGVGGATPAASGSGITFPATQSPSSDVNTLDDYEEGTWTTTIQAGQVNITGTPTLSNGTYVKVGKLVTIAGIFSANVTSGSSLTYFPFSIPFPVNSTSSHTGASTSNTGLKIGVVCPYGTATATNIYILYPPQAAQGSGVDSFYFSFTYITTA